MIAQLVRAEVGVYMRPYRFLNGYKLIFKPGHPSAMKSKNWEGYIYEHIYVAELKLGRRLRGTEIVHHLDLSRDNNNPDNLLVLEESQHGTIHAWVSRGAPILGVNGYEGTKTVYCKAEGCSNVIMTDASTCSSLCAAFMSRRTEWPDKETLEKEIGSNTMLAIGRKYKVSDNAVRKWAKKYKIDWKKARKK